MAVKFQEKAAVASDELEQNLAQTLTAYLSISMRGEDVRRRDDRIGGRLWNGQHWIGVRQYRDRAAVTANVSRALIDHKVSIICKQLPIPVVEAREPGSAEAAERMRQALMYKFDDDDMMEKSFRGLVLSNITRTCAGKVLWDPTLHGGIGDVTTDIITGWNLILDGRVSNMDLMQFCGDRSRMFRSRALSLYPKSAKKIMDAQPTSYRRGPTMSDQGSPLRDAWGSGQSLVRGEPTSINNKSVFTGYAGDPGFASTADDIVEICEIYHKDLTLYADEEPDTDEFGNEQKVMALDDEGMPQFTEAPGTMLPDEDGSLVHVPNFQLVFETKMRPVYKRKYPQWRRTTMLNPGSVILEDVAWDGPLPYFLFSDTIPLEGLWSRGSMLQLETLQAMLNVGLSVMIDNLRMGSVQAFFASAQSGIGHKVLTPGPGQVVEVNGQPSQQIMPLQVPPLAPEWFQYQNFMIALMEKVIGAEGVMQGSAKEAPRTDSAAGFDTLAEIGGSRLVSSAKRFERALKKWGMIVGWFVQNYYTEKHAIAVQDEKGDITWQQAWGPLVAGELNYGIEVGSSMAWSESAKFNRNLELFRANLIDRIEFYKRTNMVGWQQMLKRMQAAVGTPMQALMGPPPPPPKKKQQQKQSR